MSTTQQEFANDNVKVIVTRDAGCRISFDMTIPGSEVQKARLKAIKSVNKEISIPGFRKGKAPEQLVLQHYGQYVEREWRNIVMDKAFQEAIKLTNIFPLHQGSIQSPDVKELSDDGARVVIRFESAPVASDIDVGQLSLAKATLEPVKEEQVQKALEDLRLFHADWTDVTDRAVAEGDYVDLDIDAIESPSYNICTNERFEVNHERMPGWMLKLALGLNIGQSVEGISERDDKFPPTDPEAEFKPTKIRVTLKAIKHPELPAVDDSLAKKAGVDDVATLRVRIAESLERDAKAAAEQHQHNELIGQLLQKFSCDIPASLLEEERQTRIRNRIRGLRRVLSEEQIKEKSSDITAQAGRDSAVFISLYYLLRPLVQKHNLSVTQDDLYQELTRQLHHLPVEDQVIEQDMAPEAVRSKLIALVTIRKALDHLVGQLTGAQLSK